MQCLYACSCNNDLVSVVDCHKHITRLENRVMEVYEWIYMQNTNTIAYIMAMYFWHGNGNAAQYSATAPLSTMELFQCLSYSYNDLLTSLISLWIDFLMLHSFWYFSFLTYAGNCEWLPLLTPAKGLQNSRNFPQIPGIFQPDQAACPFHALYQWRMSRAYSYAIALFPMTCWV